MPPNITIGFNIFWLPDINKFRFHGVSFYTDNIVNDTLFVTPELKQGEYHIKVLGSDMNQAMVKAKELLQNYFISNNQQDLADKVAICDGHTVANYENNVLYGPVGGHRFRRE